MYNDYQQPISQPPIIVEDPEEEDEVDVRLKQVEETTTILYTLVLKIIVLLELNILENNKNFSFNTNNYFFR